MLITLNIVLIIFMIIDIITNAITNNNMKKTKKYLDVVSKQSLEIKEQIKLYQQEILDVFKAHSQ